MSFSKNNFDYLSFIKTLVSFSPRQIEGEKKAAKFMISLLEKRGVSYTLQKFNLKLPLVKKAVLRADGEELECDACSFVSGKITGKDRIISSLLSSLVCQNDTNINFNPKCPKVSCANHYFAPAVAVTHEGLKKIIEAKEVKGEIIIRKVNHEAVNILVGNKENPKNICIAHYDSIKKGAIDNASGVSLLMAAILEKPEILKNTLYVFSACEELSYEKPIYRAYGYRVFEKKYHKILNQAKKIIIIDCVGDGKVNILNDPHMSYLCFSIRNFKKLQKKVKVITGDFEHCMSIYHSDLDDGRGLKKEYLLEAQRALLKEIILI